MNDNYYVVKNEYYTENCEKDFFGDVQVKFIDETWDIYGILVDAGFFDSKSNARKNWKYEENIPNGYSYWKIGKLHRNLSILRPTKSKLLLNDAEETEDEQEYYLGTFFGEKITLKSKIKINWEQLFKEYFVQEKKLNNYGR